MQTQPTKPRTILCFEVDVITCQDWLLMVKPEGYKTHLVLSPYFIKQILKYAIKHKILKDENVQQNKTR